MNKRFLMCAALAVAACDPSTQGESALDGLPEGTDLDPDGGKADGQPQFAFASAETVSNLAYPEPDAEGEQTWTDDELKEIFADRVSPGGTAESPWNLARKAGPLGYYGPIGPYGPLGSFGPVGNNIWNPSTIISGGVPWDEFATALEEDGGPLSQDGPLGHRGPLNTETWSSFEASWDSGHPGSIAALHLRPGGMFSVLGQTGPLSALGPLGPLGPIGAHGFVRDDGGDYQPEGETCSNAPDDALEPPCRSLELDYQGDGDGAETRRYELVELYDEAHARNLGDNDTSFIVQGEMMPGDGADQFEFTSHADQWVTMLVVPEYAKYPPFQAVLDVPDMTPGGFCRAPTDGGDASCAPGAIAFQLQSHTCLDNFAGELTSVLAEITDALASADSFEEMVDTFRRFGSSTFEVLSRCSPRLPEKVYVRHALQPWSGQVAAAQFNPFICNPGTFFLNPFCRATGLNDVYAVDYDHRASFDDFDLSLDVDFAQTSGQLVSDSGDVIDWISVKVPAGTKFRASVDLNGIWEVTEQDRQWGLDLFIESAQWADTFSASDVEFMGSGSKTRPVPRYRLIVVGSSEYTQATDVAFGGSYLREL